jgi:hypothetical protein
MGLPVAVVRPLQGRDHLPVGRIRTFHPAPAGLFTVRPFGAVTILLRIRRGIQEEPPATRGVA